MAAVFTKQVLTNNIDRHRHHDESEEQESDEQTRLFSDDFHQCTAIVGHKLFRFLGVRILAHDPGQVNPGGSRTGSRP